MCHLYDGWNVVEEIDAVSWTLKAQYTWGLDLSHTLHGAGGIGGLLAAHIPAETCSTFSGGIQAVSFSEPGSLSDLGLTGSAYTSLDASGTPASLLAILADRRTALWSAGGQANSSTLQADSSTLQSDGTDPQTQTLTVGSDCDFWCLYDANGNVGQLLRYDAATSSVSLAAAYEYDPYGNTLVVRDVDGSGIAQANKFRFSTKYLDDELSVGGQPGALDTTGLYYYGYRYYSPSLGRWISRDPIGEKGGVNTQCFGGNNSISNFDPVGQAISNSACLNAVARPSGRAKCILKVLADNKCTKPAFWCTCDCARDFHTTSPNTMGCRTTTGSDGVPPNKLDVVYVCYNSNGITAGNVQEIITVNFSPF